MHYQASSPLGRSSRRFPTKRLWTLTLEISAGMAYSTRSNESLTTAPKTRLACVLEPLERADPTNYEVLDA